MNSLTLNKAPKNANPDCADRMTMAEQELTAFFGAVKELFGSEQAQNSAEDWLQELEASNGLPASAREWRLITNRVTKQLAIQLNASSTSTGSQVLRRNRICVFSSQVPQAL
jgi:hypothetical protein